MMTSEALSTDWLRLPRAQPGRDHLGVQAPCISMYAQLLPGITNVTDRAEYYAFYPWLLWSLVSRRAEMDFSRTQIVRRAECLLTLVAERHAVKSGESAGLHGLSLVGRNTLAPLASSIEEAGDVDLDAIAAPKTPEHPGAYFQNPDGGLGQYYLGPLRELGILAGDRKSGIQFTFERGEPLAKKFTAYWDAGAFLDTLQRSRVTASDLDHLAPFCPCHLPRYEEGVEALLDIFLNRSGEWDPGNWRRRTFGLLLETCARQPPDRQTEDAFRAACYTGAIRPGTTWDLPPALEACRDAWGIYQRNELLSIALQAMFSVALRVAEQDPGRGVPSREIEARVHGIARKALGGRAEQTFQDAVKAAREALPPLEEWDDTAHEVSLGIHQTKLGAEGAPVEIVQTAIDLLIALAARGGDDDPYREFAFSEEYFRYYPLNLRSFARAQRDWSSLTLAEVCSWLAIRWGVDTHVRVALRKLHHESVDTFRIRPDEHGYRVVAIPPPLFTTPRISNALQFATDLGLLQYSDRRYTLTEVRGGAMLEEIFRG